MNINRRIFIISSTASAALILFVFYKLALRSEINAAAGYSFLGLFSIMTLFIGMFYLVELFRFYSWAILNTFEKVCIYGLESFPYITIFYYKATSLIEYYITQPWEFSFEQLPYHWHLFLACLSIANEMAVMAILISGIILPIFVWRRAKKRTLLLIPTTLFCIALLIDALPTGINEIIWHAKSIATNTFKTRWYSLKDGNLVPLNK